LSLSSVPAGLTFSWNQATGVLTVLSSGADPTDAIWQSALRNVVYVNSSDTPPASRSITVSASDDQGSLGTATAAVAITTINDAPTVDLNGAGTGTSTALTYTENAAPTAIAGLASISDVDSLDFSGGSLRISFTSNKTTSDQLSILAGSGVSLSGNNVSVGGV